MAVLSDGDRQLVRDEWMRDPAFSGETCSITKADIRAAINALDDFLNTNAASINTAIPQPARSALSTAQKARLLNYVIRKRYISGA